MAFLRVLWIASATLKEHLVEGAWTLVFFISPVRYFLSTGASWRVVRGLQQGGDF